MPDAAANDVVFTSVPELLRISMLHADLALRLENRPLFGVQMPVLHVRHPLSYRILNLSISSCGSGCGVGYSGRSSGRKDIRFPVFDPFLKGNREKGNTGKLLWKTRGWASGQRVATGKRRGLIYCLSGGAFYGYCSGGIQRP